jgi:hypothetical protein
MLVMVNIHESLWLDSAKTAFLHRCMGDRGDHVGVLTATSQRRTA